MLVVEPVILNPLESLMQGLRASDLSQIALNQTFVPVERPDCALILQGFRISFAMLRKIGPGLAAMRRIFRP
jgi:hypothetical protein